MSKFDPEVLLTTAEDFFKANFNNKVDEINTEKTTEDPTTFTIDQVGDNAWLDTLDERAASYTKYIYFGVMDLSPVSNNGETAKQVDLFFQMTLLYGEQTYTLTKELLRYTRALEEVAQDFSDEVSEATDMEIIEMPPMTVENEDSGNFYRVAGIVLRTTIV